MTVVDALRERATLEQRRALERMRQAARFVMSRRDRSLPLLARISNLTLPGPAGPLPARLYVPRAATANGPTLVFFHGGGFVVCDIETHDAFCVRLADEAGVKVISCDYRLAPEAPFPAQLDDALAACRWILDQAGELEINPDALALGGDSAGGYLALAATRRLNAERPGAVKALLLVYPLLHLDDEIWANSLLEDSRVVGRLAVGFIRAQLATTEAPSLLNDIDPATPPTLLVAGGALDPCRPDAIALGEKLAGAGVAVETRWFEDQMHGFINLTHLNAAIREAVAEIGQRTGRLLRTACAA